MGYRGLPSSEWRKMGRYPALSRDEGAEPGLYLRFVTDEVDPDSGLTQGLFRAVGILRRSGVLEEHEAIWYSDVTGWFEKHLRAPTKDNFLPAPRRGEWSRVIFWMKGSADEHVSRLRQVAALLGHYRVPTRVLKTTRPGRIVYEDDFQVGAIPLRDGLA